MDVSVIIVTRNTCQLTCDAVHSVLAGVDDLAKEIVIVDNGSTDETPAVLAREFPAVRCIRSERNLGFARAANRAAQVARGAFLLLLNSDARVAPDTLAKALPWMRANPEYAVAGAQLLHPDGSRQNSIANFPTLATELLNKSLLRRLWPSRFPGKEHECREPREVDTVVGAFMLIRKSAWDTLGGLDERFFFFFEETDFCLRAHQRGWRVAHLPQVRVWHGQGQTAKHTTAAARIEYWRSRSAYLAKHFSPWARAAVGGGLRLRLLVNWLVSGACALATFGAHRRWRERWQTYSALVGWLARGEPPDVGLPR